LHKWSIAAPTNCCIEGEFSSLLLKERFTARGELSELLDQMPATAEPVPFTAGVAPILILTNGRRPKMTVDRA
jgi:hypothetical protein